MSGFKVFSAAIGLLGSRGGGGGVNGVALPMGPGLVQEHPPPDTQGSQAPGEHQGSLPTGLREPCWAGPELRC